MSRMHNGLDDVNKLLSRANLLVDGEDTIDVAKT